MSQTIMIVEDDEFIRDGLKSVLLKEEYTVVEFAELSSARKFLQGNSPDLLLLDVLLPDGNGHDFCSEIRQQSSFPIVFLTCCDDEINTVRGLDCGGDDYIAKPFRLKELLSRIKAILRRSNAAAETVSVAGLTLNSAQRIVKCDGKTVFLTPIEYSILAHLIKNKNIIITRENLLDVIWDYNGEFVENNTLSVHISRLREKLGDKDYIVTVRGVGYRFDSAPHKKESGNL